MPAPFYETVYRAVLIIAWITASDTPAFQRAAMLSESTLYAPLDVLIFARMASSVRPACRNAVMSSFVRATLLTTNVEEGRGVTCGATFMPAGVKFPGSIE